MKILNLKEVPETVVFTGLSSPTSMLLTPLKRQQNWLPVVGTQSGEKGVVDF